MKFLGNNDILRKENEVYRNGNGKLSEEMMHAGVAVEKNISNVMRSLMKDYRKWQERGM